MATVIVYRSTSASFAAKRVAKAGNGKIRATQEDTYRYVGGDRTVVRWDCYEDFGHVPSDIIDLNPALAVQMARDKGTSRRLLAELAPPTWFTRPDIQLPAVVRPRQHKAGRRFFVCHSVGEVIRAVKRCGEGWYASRLIGKKREFRVFVVQGRVVAVSERFPSSPSDIAWNLARGGRLINVNRKDWPISVVQAGIAAMGRIGLGFGAVDVCLDESDVPWVFEVNTSPALRNKWTIRQIARGLAYEGEVKPVKEGAKKTRSYAHPAVLDKGDAP